MRSDRLFEGRSPAAAISLAISVSDRLLGSEPGCLGLSIQRHGLSSRTRSSTSQPIIWRSALRRRATDRDASPPRCQLARRSRRWSAVQLSKRTCRAARNSRLARRSRRYASRLFRERPRSAAIACRNSVTRRSGPAGSETVFIIRLLNLASFDSRCRDRLRIHG